MAHTHLLGYPRIGAQRELKHALERFWQGKLSADELQLQAATLRQTHWQTQRDKGLDFLCVGDFAFYDHVLDHQRLFGLIPTRFAAAHADASPPDFATQFTLARGTSTQTALALTKWFDTNYHYLVPELDEHTQFSLHSAELLSRIREAKHLGQAIKPVLIGPITLLWLARQPSQRLSLLPRLLPYYRQLLTQIAAEGVEWVQLDEPALVLDLPTDWQAAYDQTYTQLSDCGVKVLLATYFEGCAEHAVQLSKLPIHGYHIDCVRAPTQLPVWLAALPQDRVLSVGIIDGRNIWRNDLRASLKTLQYAQDQLHERLWIAPSCSLLHSPISLASETRLDPELKTWLAFADEKLDELHTLSQALQHGANHCAAALDAADHARATRLASPRVTNPSVRKRLAQIQAHDSQRQSPFATRQVQQQATLQLPPLPTTTIGSFPQTDKIRQLRAAHKRREIGELDYLQGIRQEIAYTIEAQEALELDVLVHGEAERNDMVEYFGERLNGYAFSDYGWVQSYGSRCVKPPILFGDVWRAEAMTIGTASYAQSLTKKPVKGMLSGPLTLLQWSFVRDDQARQSTALQLALALRDEVKDLENAGIRIIQIDEPGLREGLPLKSQAQSDYLNWATLAFRLAASVVSDSTQIHTHMCYAEYQQILPAIAALDADVITLETARSHMQLLDAFADFNYPNQIGPGVYDIHAPRVPSVAEISALLQRACQVIAPNQLWVNPDCGLKTRAWPETRAALTNMLLATKALRAQLASGQTPAAPALNKKTPQHTHGADCGCALAAQD